MVYDLLTVQECDYILGEWFHIEKGNEPTNEYISAKDRKIQSIENISTSFDFVDRLQDHAEKQFGPLKFENTYMRAYPKGSALNIHTDRGELDVTLSLCLWKPKDLDYPIFVSNTQYENHEIEEIIANQDELKKDKTRFDLDIGQGCFLEGKKYPHWRDEQLSEYTPLYIFYHWSKKSLQNS